jgi:hypothetical protein
MPQESRDPFRLPPPPRTGLETLLWILLEPDAPQHWSYHQGRKEAAVLYLRALPWVSSIASLSWLMALAIVAGLELPLRFPEQFKVAWAELLQAEPNLIEPLFVIGLQTSGDWALGVGVSMAVGLALSLSGQAEDGVKICLAGSLSLGLIAGLASGLSGCLAWSLSSGVAVGSALGLVSSLMSRAPVAEKYWVFAFSAPTVILQLLLFWSIPVTVAAFLAALLPNWEYAAAKAWRITSCLAFFGCGASLVHLSIVFRLPFYLPQATMALIRLDLRHNPYLRDGRVILPLWGARRRLMAEAADDPETGMRFVNFLLQYRPLQRSLAGEMLHAVQAGRWRLAPLDARALEPPGLVADQPDQHPSKRWLDKVATLRTALIEANQESQISLQRDAYSNLVERLLDLRESTLRESQGWARHYVRAIDSWRDEAGKECRNIEQRARTEEPITRKVYNTGKPLRADRDADLFLGRDDLRKKLWRELRTSRELPLLLIQGQRRVGKTSLLNFLPELLPPGFQLVQQDVQDGCIGSIPEWLKDLRRRAAKACSVDAGDWSPPIDWLNA